MLVLRSPGWFNKWEFLCNFNVEIGANIIYLLFYLCSANTDHAPVAPSVIDLSKVKPRVNSHWGGAMPRATTAINRSNSLRDIGKTATTNAGTIGGPRLLRSRIGTTAATQAVKYVTTTTRTTRSKSPAVTTVTVTNVMRRQDSTLSRRSLTKLRAGEKVAPVASKVKVEPTAPQEKKENAVMPPAHSMRMILVSRIDFCLRNPTKIYVYHISVNSTMMLMQATKRIHY